jgi:hypothetical protein
VTGPARAECPDCGKDVAVKKDGTLRAHVCERPPPTRIVDAPPLPRVVRDLYALDALRPRSVQTEIGISALVGCARRAAHTILGTPETNEPDKLAAVIGTAVHKACEDATKARNPFAETELEVRIPDFDLLGHVDCWDPIDRAAEDYKTSTVERITGIRLDGPTRQQRAQVQTYGYALALKGYPVEKVRLVFLPRDGRGDQAYVWEAPYDEAQALEALLWLDGVRQQVANGVLPPPERFESSFCRDWCPFYDPAGVGSGCTGIADRPVDVEITDPELVEAAREYADGAALAKRGGELKDAAKARLEGVVGRAGDLVVSWSNPKERLVLDEDAVRETYAAAGLPLPVRRETATARISVKPAPDRPAENAQEATA